MTSESSNSIIEVTKKKKKEMNNPYPMTLESFVFKCINNGM
jgi:hypothetical protein